MIIRKYTDYVDKVHEKFPDVPIKELQTIMRFGLRSFYLHNLYGGDVLLKSPYFTLYSGKMFSDNLVFYHYWKIKYKIKLRIRHKRARKPYSGKYYFGMTEKQYEEYVSSRKTKGRSKTKVTIEHLFAYKIMEEAMLDRGKKHFFILYYDSNVGFSFYKKNYTTRNIEYFAWRDKNNQIKFLKDE